MKEREMKRVEQLIERGEGKHRYGGKQALVRLSIETYTENLAELCENLKKLPIVPTMILKNHNRVTIDWWAKNNQIIFGKDNYVKVIKEFLNYVEEIGFDKWMFDSGCLDDCLPFDLNHLHNNLMVIVNPNFTVENFNNNGDIEIEIDGY
ncbi:MAG: hypothetical protein ACRC7N_11125 [Clostridium sp.]